MLSLSVSNSDSASMAAGSDLVRSYLRDIGRVPLLS
ncbi:MAG: RNA polymerase sigma factor, RpoD/SigA family, partial [Synechococcales cyanobacterium SupBloom_Metag_052]|nr:RNA polymerase sigma factor, RpoD/SigA family [Synechococcales cyanobacterium SupBloom_Metag_052]